MTKSYLNKNVRCGKCYEKYVITEYPNPINPEMGDVVYKCPRCGNYHKFVNVFFELPKKKIVRKKKK